MLARGAQLDQFESGVFSAVPSEILTPVFRDKELWTDDEDFADLGDAVVEIRAFDTSYISVASADTRLIQCIEATVLTEWLTTAIHRSQPSAAEERQRQRGRDAWA